MKRILAATDFSTRAHRAIRRAAVLARKSGAELTLLHIVDEEPEALVALEVAGKPQDPQRADCIDPRAARRPVPLHRCNRGAA